jgi:hypothetical protein
MAFLTLLYEIELSLKSNTNISTIQASEMEFLIGVNECTRLAKI